MSTVEVGNMSNIFINTRVNFESGLDSAAICVQSMEQNLSYSLWKIKHLVHNILTKVPLNYVQKCFGQLKTRFGQQINFLS